MAYHIIFIMKRQTNRHMKIILLVKHTREGLKTRTVSTTECRLKSLLFVKKTIFFLVRARLCSTVTQRVSQPHTWHIKFPIKDTHPHNLGSLLLVLKISLKSFVHLYPSAKSLSLQGKCCLRSGSKDDILVGLLEQYHWGEPVCFKNSAVLLTA